MTKDEAKKILAAQKKSGGPASKKSLRDYFAAKALQGLLAAAPERLHNSESETSQWAYAFADAMLKERDK